MADPLTLEVVTPQKKILEVETPWVNIPGVVGELGILPDHVPVLTTIKSGVLSWSENGKDQFAAIHHGYAQVESNRVTILSEMAEYGVEIDRERANDAIKRAEEELHKAIEGEAKSEARMKKYTAKLDRATSRLRASI